MCGNVQERVFINITDTKHSLIVKHREHFAWGDIISVALAQHWNEKRHLCIVKKSLE